MRASPKQIVVIVTSLASTLLIAPTAAATGPAPPGASSAPSVSPPHYDHIFVIVEENHGFQDVIGNPAAPNLNALAQQFGLATNYFGISHPSEPNYVALLGGNTFGIADDNPYFLNTVNKPSLISQLDDAGITWKAYLQGLPHPGYKDICYPARCNGTPDADPLYVSKHDAIQNFTTSLNPDDWSRQVPLEELDDDLSSSKVPAFGYIIPDECHDMHGDPPYCIDGGNPGDPQDQRLVTIGDQTLAETVSAITNASFWSKGNNAVVVTYDEGDDNAGCCGAPSPNGGGQVASIVITSHGPRALQDPTPYNHFSLLQTIQQNFGLGCLELTCDTADVKPMTALFAVSGSNVVPTSGLAVPNFPTPSPAPLEPSSATTLTPSAAGWHVVAAPLFGTNDNSLGSVSGSAPDDVWAVGNFLPDTPTSNQDATLSLAVHFDGSSWKDVPTPNVGPNFNTLFSVTSLNGQAWAVGVHLDDEYRDRALVEHWDGTDWTVVDVPQPGSERDLLYSVSASTPSDIWAVGDQEGTDGKFQTLAEHWDGQHWSMVRTPDPGSSGNHLFGVAMAGADDAWAVGQQLDPAGHDETLIEHWNGRHWAAVPSPSSGADSALLDAVAIGPDGVWAVGKTISAVAGDRPLVEQLRDGAWQTVEVPAPKGAFNDLLGVTVANSGVWAVGTFFDSTSGSQQTFTLHGTDHGWSLVHRPDPGSGDHILGGVTAVGETLWAVGTYDDGGSGLPLIERHNN
jgi:hypothetical protein